MFHDFVGCCSFPFSSLPYFFFFFISFYRSVKTLWHLVASFRRKRDRFINYYSMHLFDLVVYCFRFEASRSNDFCFLFCRLPLTVFFFVRSSYLATLVWLLLQLFFRHNIIFVITCDYNIFGYLHFTATLPFIRSPIQTM